MENFFSTVSTAIDSQNNEKPNNDSVEAAANILDVTEDIGRTMASTLGKWWCGRVSVFGWLVAWIFLMLMTVSGGRAMSVLLSTSLIIILME